jgi:hypothetical protein
MNATQAGITCTCVFGSNLLIKRAHGKNKGASWYKIRMYNIFITLEATRMEEKASLRVHAPRLASCPCNDRT